MAGLPLNNSWPSFSKLWIKRWSFKRASECKPWSPQSPSVTEGGCESHLSQSPPSITEDVFFSTTPEEKDGSSVESDYDDPVLDVDSSLEDILALQGTEYFRDLEGLDTPNSGLKTTLSIEGSSVCTQHLCPGLHIYPLATSASCPWYHLHNPALPQLAATTETNQGQVSELAVSANSPENWELQENMDPKSPENRELQETMEPNSPVLLRSMSISRRHSWGVPVCPLENGRRLSLDSSTMDSEKEEDSPLQSSGAHLPEGCFRQLSEGGPPSPQPKEQELEKSGRGLYSRSEILASERSRTARMLETSKQTAGAVGDELNLEGNLQTEEGQCRMLMVQKVLQELRQYHGAKQRTVHKEGKESSGNVTWYEFLSKENVEEEDQAEKVERGAKVKRTLSSLKNRVTGSFGKDKGTKTQEREHQKEREKEKDQQKEKEREQQREREKERDQQKEREKEKEREPKEKEKSHCGKNGHQLVAGTFSSLATCSLCCKGLQKKHGLQCLNCAVNVHKSCKNLLPECVASKNKLKDSQNRNTVTVQNIVHFYNQAQKEHLRSAALDSDGLSGSPRGSGMTITQRVHRAQPAAASASTSVSPSSSTGSFSREMDETDIVKFKLPLEDSVSLASSTTESLAEDASYAALRQDLDSDAQDFELESWSLAVDQQYLKRHPKVAIKRQDVIYELVQTEVHHVRTLKVMLGVYLREMREALQMDERKVERLFPRLEDLLEIHSHFLSRLKERRRESLQAGSERNYSIQQLGDVLISQFSGEIGERMKESYSDFCSHHSEAVSFYKEQLQNNRRFQCLIRKMSHLSIMRRLTVPECILLVTQRITKYPVLVERILHNTDAGTEEHEDLTRALALIREAIMHVDVQVNDHERAARLKDIASRIEPKSLGKVKEGHVFRREELTQGRRRLLHEATVNWKAASGRLKDILAVLLSDVLLLLQEKDQKYTFSTVDNKPSVISLQKLIVREVAHEEKAMFLICASSREPEMYEIHTASKEERNTWMAVIRQAVESCPYMEEELVSEQEVVRAVRLKEFQDRLNVKDAQITQSLTEKLQIFADITEKVLGNEDASSCSRLLLRGEASDLQRGEQLLKGAITDVENLQNLLLSSVMDISQPPEESQSSGVLPRRAGTFGGYDSNPTVLNKNGSGKKAYCGEGKPKERSQRASSDPQLKELCTSESLEQLFDEISSTSWNTSSSFPGKEFFDRVMMLSQRLYSLQAIISHQDSYIELQRASLTGRPRGSGLLEQEKQRNLEKQREEQASFHRLQSRHQQEQLRWERQREAQQLQAQAAEAQLRARQEECRRLEAQLAEERQELERHRETYQQDLERLRESTRAVEKEKERLEQQKKFKKHKTIANPGLLALEAAQAFPHSSIFNGEFLLGNTGGDLALAVKPHVRPSLSMSSTDYLERPEVPPRRESINPLSVKTEVPIHLISTTNQVNKLGAVQQQIPTKLAISRGKEKEKSGKSKASHRSDSSASVDIRHVPSFRLTGKEDGTLRGRRSVSPHQLYYAESATPPDSYVDPQPSYTASIHKQISQGASLHLPPPYKVKEDSAKEDVIFF